MRHYQPLRLSHLLTAAAEHPEDMPAYTAAKEPVIQDLVKQAYEKGYADELPTFEVSEE